MIDLWICFQECSEGYRRTGGGLYLGLCEPCECNGHSSECDTLTGKCKVSWLLTGRSVDWSVSFVDLSVHVCLLPSNP